MLLTIKKIFSNSDVNFDKSVDDIKFRVQVNNNAQNDFLIGNYLLWSMASLQNMDGWYITLKI